MNNSFRTHHIGALSATQTNEKVRISGWVHTVRDHGGVIFLMLRDEHGLAQVVVNPESKSAMEIAAILRNEWVVTVSGTVTLRSSETINKALSTGEIEIMAETIVVLNSAKTPPFEIDSDLAVRDEAIRYRYLHLRRPEIKRNILLRSKVTKKVRDFLCEEGFHEIETPILTKATPEGARDFLVPSRVFPGEFYALPQSPQQYKQLLMVAGFDKYFQIARALRDEDSRADRQSEHTQIDMEMAFTEKAEIMALLERMFIAVTTEIFPKKKIVYTPFRHLTYHEAMEDYGNDKPDLRFELKLLDIKSVFANTTFKIFKPATTPDGILKAIVVPNKAGQSRKQLSKLVELSQSCGMAGVVIAQQGEDNLKSTAGGGITESELEAVFKKTNATNNDLVLLLGASNKNHASGLASFSLFRAALGEYFQLINHDQLAFAFVEDFPLVEWNSEEKRFDPLHHMFVLPREEDIPLLDSAPEKVLSTQFDLVCNGYELCSGSRRIHTPELQRKIMRMIGLKDEEIDEKFAHILKAFSYGAPPHGGAAPGLDRLLMVLLGTPNIRDVIAFPKTQRGQDLMMESPALPSSHQLAELALKIDYDAMKAARREELQKKMVDKNN